MTILYLINLVENRIKIIDSILQDKNWGKIKDYGEQFTPRYKLRMEKRECLKTLNFLNCAEG